MGQWNPVTGQEAISSNLKDSVIRLCRWGPCHNKQPCYFDLHHLKGWVYSEILKEEDRSGFCYVLDSLDRYDGTQNMMINYQLLLTIKHSGSTAEKYFFSEHDVGVC